MSGAPNFDAVARRQLRFGPGGLVGGSWTPGAGGVPTADAPGSSGGVLVPPIPEQVAPPSAAYFAAQGTLSGVNAAAGQVVLGAFQVADNSVAVIRSILVSAAPWTLTSLVRWAVLLDGVPAPGWADMRIPRTPAAAIAREFTAELVTLRVGAGQLVEVVAQVDLADAGVYQLEGEARGWTYPVEVYDRFRAGWG